MSDDRSAAAVRDASATRAAILLALAAIVTAALGGRAALLASSANDAWHYAARQEVQQGSFYVADAIVAYHAAAAADDAVGAALLAQELLRRTTNASPFEQQIEATVQTKVAQSIAQSNRSAYGVSGRYVVDQKLAALDRAHTAPAEFSPAAFQREGDHASRKASRIAAAAVPAALAFLLGALAQAFAGLRRPLVLVAGLALLSALVLELIVEVVY